MENLTVFRMRSTAFPILSFSSAYSPLNFTVETIHDHPLKIHSGPHGHDPPKRMA